jgi:hypothetical protein
VRLRVADAAAGEGTGTRLGLEFGFRGKRCGRDGGGNEEREEGGDELGVLVLPVVYDAGSKMLSLT